MKSIGEVAKAARVAPSTIRYYEKLGLLPMAMRQSGRRIYHPEMIKRIKMIRAAQSVGWSLAEVKEILGQATPLDEPSIPARWKRGVPDKIAELNEKIAELQEMKDTLAQSMDCGCQSIVDCDLIAKRL